jgi:hypothetical protein
MTKTGSRKTTDSETNQALESLLKALQGDHSHEVLGLFLKDQAQNVFPKDQHTLQWLTERIGRKATTRLVGVLADLPCFNCKDGSLGCDNCEDVGGFKIKLICESCLSLGRLPCDFCGGTGLASIDFLPVGLRLAVFAVRLENAEKQIEASLKGPIAQPSKEDAAGAFRDCIDLLFNLNRQISVLESSVGVTKDMIKVPQDLKRQISKITRKAVRTAIKGEKRLGEIVETIAIVCKMQSENEEKGSEMQKLAIARANFYSSLLSSKPWFAGTYLEHLFLNEAAKKLIVNKGS